MPPIRNADTDSSPRRWLALHAGSLGDCVLAIHLLSALRSGGRPVVVMLAARSSVAEWAAKNGLIESAMSHDRLMNSRSNLDIMVTAVPAGRFEGVVSFVGECSVAFQEQLRGVCGGPVHVVDPRAREGTARAGHHITQQWAADLVALGCDVDMTRIGTATLTGDPRSERRRAKADCFASEEERSVLIHPGSGGLKKCLSLKLLEGLAATIQRGGHRVSWMIGPDEVERFGPSFTERHEGSARVIYEEHIGNAADIVAGADLFIGHDAGMTHVAAMTGTKTIAAFGPTDPRVWRPLGPHVEVILFPEDNATPARWLESVAERITQIVSK